jgi:hypothetical protein
MEKSINLDIYPTKTREKLVCFQANKDIEIVTSRSSQKKCTLQALSENTKQNKAGRSMLTLINTEFKIKRITKETSFISF